MGENFLGGNFLGGNCPRTFSNTFLFLLHPCDKVFFFLEMLHLFVI